MRSEIHYCLYEDREEARVGIKLLAASLERHCRDFQLHIYLDEIPEELLNWCVRHAPHAKLRTAAFRGRTWNIKSDILLDVLKEHPGRVVWIDSDIIALQNLDELWNVSDETLIVTEEFDRPNRVWPAQIAAYGYPAQRILQCTINSGLVGVTSRHATLLEEWGKALNNTAYLAADALPYRERPRGLRGDQDILDYLLSANPAFTQIPVNLLTVGRQIIQEHGLHNYRAADRLRNGLGFERPYLVHGLGEKPWNRRLDGWFARSPYIYFAAASDYESCLSEDPAWKALVGDELYAPEPFRHLMGLPSTCLTSLGWALRRTRPQ